MSQTARFDTRLPSDLKLLFERAAELGGFKSLSDFVLKTVSEKAEEIIRHNEEILASKKDAALFFNLLASPPSPNEELKKAAQEYRDIFQSHED